MFGRCRAEHGYLSTCFWSLAQGHTLWRLSARLRASCCSARVRVRSWRAERTFPLDQILAGPRRAKVEFEPGSDARGLGAMLAGFDMEGQAATPLARPGRRKGWGA